MKKDFLNIFLGFIFSMFIVCILGINFVWADTDGVWLEAEDILGGVFGSDEQSRTFNYTFINPVYFEKNISISQNIGINYNSPETEVDIGGRWFVRSQGTTPTTGSGMFGLYDSTLGSGVGIIQAYDYDSSVAKNLVFQSGGGNVGIGVTNPTERLEIAGNIKANDIIVNNLQLPRGDLEVLYVNEGQANSIDSSMIIDGSIQKVDLGVNSVDSSKVVDNSLTANDLATNSVGSSEINSNEVQRRVTGSCSNGAIERINSDGTVVCESISMPVGVGVDYNNCYQPPDLGSGGNTANPWGYMGNTNFACTGNTVLVGMDSGSVTNVVCCRLKIIY